ncbi:cyclic nucleotide-binding domain-containing protein [Hyalangium rubrum]|uniref:Cyclic nucleotide-binding domain-containing protein n=1 Tax=Hyalangium rubrum TaxID=3103134 RepID=A0ABU5H723_9BACT|nr:cyclic nucleotide-binding domain-containing protein [Hyalangium sp. s54d21]MDY7227890.1 cyclic nucleotide-binding domain-containing protein [Hyalangium sp. s54d21]
MGQRDDNERTELAVNPLYMMEGMEALKTSSLFGQLNEAELKTLFQAGERRVFQDGEELVKKGDDLDAFWVVVSGRVEVARDGSSTEQGAATFFGDRALAGTVPSPLSCRAVAEGEALRFSRASLVKLSREFPKLGVKILWVLLENAYKNQDSEED